MNLVKLHLGVDHVIWTLLIVEIGVEYRKISILCFLCCCEMYLEALSRYRKGWVISLKKLAEQFVLFDQPKNKKVNKHIVIKRQFQNSTTCPNDMIHTLVCQKDQMDILYGLLPIYS